MNCFVKNPRLTGDRRSYGQFTHRGNERLLGTVIFVSVPSTTTLPHSSVENGFVLTPRCFFTIEGETVSIPRFVASQRLSFSCWFITDILCIRSGSAATPENVMCVVPTKFAPKFLRLLQRSVIASLFGIKSLLSQPLEASHQNGAKWSQIHNLDLFLLRI